MPNGGHAEVDSVLALVPGIAGRIDSDTLRLYIGELLSWNPRIGLVSKQDTVNVLARLISKSVSLWDLFVDRVPEMKPPAGLTVVDIGSGGGFPGLIWKLLNPGISVTLVERKEKKAFFLEKSAALLGVDSLHIIQKDARDLARNTHMRESFDVAVMMAVSRPAQMGDAVEGLLKPGGVFLAPRGAGEMNGAVPIGNSMRIRDTVIGNEGPTLIYIKSAA